MPSSVARIEPADSPEPISAPPARYRTPIITLLLCGVCAFLFVGITSGGQQSWESLATWGYAPSQRVWDGAYWALVSSAFVHLTLWHVAFNVYWLWVIGGPVERALGPLPYLGFVLASAVVSSSMQLAVSGNTGYGASGVVYALFGLMWASRRSVASFEQTLGQNTAILFWTWLVGCIVATQAGMAQVGNAAHLGGITLGLLAAGWRLPRSTHRTLAMAGTGLLIVFSLVPLFWSPWSPTWVGYRAYKAHVAGDYNAAISGYRRSIALGGDRSWALANLAFAYHSKGAEKEYVATLAEIRAVDAGVAAKVEAEIKESADRGTTKQQ